MPKLRPLLPWLISATIIAAGLVHATRPPATPAQACGITEDTSATKPGAIEVSLWAAAPGNECWRAYMASVAAPLVTDYAIQARPTALAMNYGPAYDLIAKAAAEGRAPDIVWVQDVRAAQEAGFIVMLDSCIRSHVEFQNINPKLWSIFKWDGHTWAVPMDMGFTSLFFNKTLLRQMGWSQARVDALADDIQAGRFTLDDLRARLKKPSARASSSLASASGPIMRRGWPYSCSITPMVVGFTMLTQSDSFFDVTL
jgi:maltose-binding protein MalE